MIKEAFVSCGVQYGFENHAWPGSSALKPKIVKAYFKKVMANNKQVENWVGVSEGEYLKAEKGFKNAI